MQKFKQYLMIIIPVILIVIIVGVGFYWFQYIPYKTRKNCVKTSVDFMQKSYTGSDIDSQDYYYSYNLVYKICLNTKGVRE